MKVLVATDGSKAALHAVKDAIKLLKALSSPSSSVTLGSIHDDVGSRHAKRFVGIDAVADYLREPSEKELRPARKLLDAACIRQDRVIKTGHSSQEIVDFARSSKFDWIVLGSKGRSAISDILLGSVAQRVLMTATCPVLLVN